MKPIYFGLLSMVIVSWAAVSQVDSQRKLAGVGPGPASTSGLQLEMVGTDQVYFTHNGQPLLSFGGLSDYTFYGALDAYDYVQWADWAAAHGINHVRAYPPLSWKSIEKFALENGGSPKQVLFPYEETEPGSRQFDLTRFNEDYWQRFRRKCEHLQSKGIIIHLLMVNGWQLTRDTDRDWGGHFFNPANNINAFTDHLGGGNRLRFYHSVAGNKTGLVHAQRAWLGKLVETTADLDNVYYDLVHEIAPSRNDWVKDPGEWAKVQRWVDEMATAVGHRWAELQPERPVILGMDAGPLTDSQRDWIFTRPYFDLLIYGKAHAVNNAKNWRMKYKKPYIPQESWDDNGDKWSYRCPDHRVHIRKYMWKFMMAGCQQLDLYMKPRSKSQAKVATNPPGYPHNYDPNGWNKFEDDAVILVEFWQSLIDYPDLGFQGRVQSGPGSHQYVLSSAKEVIVYCSSATGESGVRFAEETLQLEDLSLDNGIYSIDIIKPDAGTMATRTLTVSQGVLSLKLPSFTDDLVVHVYR